MASYTFDPSEVDEVREQAESRALEVGSKLVDDQSAAKEEGYQRARDQVAEESRYAGKYKSAEELEKAYLELQKKLGENSAEPQDEEEPQEDEEEVSKDEDVEEDEEEVDEVYQALTEASEEFNKGGLTPETLDRLSQIDSRQLVETWAQYVQSQNEQAKQAQLSDDQVNTIRQIAGGDQAYQEMLGWAADNLSPDEIAAYDAVMNGGDYGAMYWAAQGLKARFGAEVGYEGKSYTGARAPKAEPGFRSQAELARAIADPRYRNDPAYRLDVEDKLARSGDLL